MKNPTLIQLKNNMNELRIHRNFNCPEYNECLTDAAFRDLDLHCQNCPLKDTKLQPAFDEVEVPAPKSFIDYIFAPA